MTRVIKTSGLRILLASSVAASALCFGTIAQAQDNCAATAGVLAEACTNPAETTVVTRPIQPNLSNEPAPDLGDLGFSISLDGAAEGATPTRRTLAGAPARPLVLRDADIALRQNDVDLTYDGLGGRPRLAVSTSDMRQSFRSGERVTFRASSNYPAWIAAAEVRITDLRGREVARLPIAANGTAVWVMPEATGIHPETEGEYLYYLRVQDRQGRRDETHSLSLSRASTIMATDLTGQVVAAGEGEDMTARRGIPVAGGAITISGRAGIGRDVRVMGEAVPVDARGGFVTQRILPPGSHAVDIWLDGQAINRQVTIAPSEWFGTGIVDLTFGRNREGSWRTGRIAGFTQGTMASGWRFTGSVDTQEDELRDLFRNFGRKNPDQTLRSMRAQEVFNTFGDDSVTSELAPTSGKVFLRAEKDGSYLQWGDFKPLSDSNLTVRSDRALYGMVGEYRAPDVTRAGDPKQRLSGFAAQADSLMQRDVMRGTGGSAYFLSRQDILSDSEVVYVEYRSRTTGLVVERRQLSEGSDYRVNAVQGVIILNGPLPSTSSGAGLIRENPAGDFDVNLVAQYEYVPTTGSVDGYTAGARAESWAGDSLRFGTSVLRETTGIADNALDGVDILWRGSESRELLLEYAQSEGPGFGSTFSLNGGLDLEPANPSAGLPGLRAQSLRLSGRSDLAWAGLNGEIAGYYDRKEAGFTSPDDDINYDQEAWGLAGEIALTARSQLTFGGEELQRDDGQHERKVRLGFGHQLADRWRIEAEVAHDLKDGTDIAGDIGTRTDAGLRLTWAPEEDHAAWVFGQTTLARDATRRNNDRAGIGFKTRLTERTSVLAEVSEGTLGTGARLEFGYRPNDRTTATIGYALDPTRRYETSDFSGRDRGSLVFGLTSTVNDRWSYVTESNYSAFGSRPSLTSGYGVTYTPSERWKIDGLVQYGESREGDGYGLERRGLSLGARFNEGEDISAGLRGEWRREEGDRPDNRLDRETWLVSGFYETKVSDDWRFVSSVDAQVSQSDESAFRDGRYIEARLGYAWRPASNDRLNALFSYTYLEDLPGADQVNIDGEIEGPQQKSHILNTALSWKATPVWTLGAKYGYRLREAADRGTQDFRRSEAHLAVLRADYHLVHNWDLMAEVRGLWTPASSQTEKTALVGVYRLFGDNLRVGGGYLWGDVSDDLRKIKRPETGFFINITTQF